MEESVDSFSTPEEPVPAECFPDTEKDAVPVEEDSFQCTFFRESKHNSTLTNDIPTPFNSSDSEIEFEEPVIFRSFDGSSINSDILYAYDDEDFELDRKGFDSPKVTFGQTLYMASDSATTLHSEKQLTICNDIPTKTEELTNDKYNLIENSNMKNKNHDQKDKMLLVKCMNNDRYTHAFPDARYVFYGTKRSYDLANNGNETTVKRRRVYGNRVVKYKRLLKSMENVIHTLSEQESIKPRNKVAETNLVKTVTPTEQSQSPETVVHNPQIDEFEMIRPIFKNPKLEKFLNESMHRAVEMYRTCRNTWSNIYKEKLGSSDDFPGTNISVSRLSCQNSFTV